MQILPGFPLERLPDRIVCADFLKEALQIEGFYVFEDSETGETFISF